MAWRRRESAQKGIHTPVITQNRPYKITRKLANDKITFDFAFFHWPGFRLGLREAYCIDYGNSRLEPFVPFAW